MMHINEKFYKTVLKNRKWSKTRKTESSKDRNPDDRNPNDQKLTNTKTR